MFPKVSLLWKDEILQVSGRLIFEFIIHFTSIYFVKIIHISTSKISRRINGEDVTFVRIVCKGTSTQVQEHVFEVEEEKNEEKI